MKNLSKAVLGLLALTLVFMGSPPVTLAQDAGGSNSETADVPPLTVSELFQYLEGATIAILLHEIGHAVIDIYDIPIVASEEDAADEFATIMLYQLSQLSGDGRTLALNFVDFFETYAREKQRSDDDKLLDTVYADEHDLAERRAFKVLCNTYAAFVLADRQTPGLFGPQLLAYQGVLVSLGADSGRIAKCETDFARALSAWGRFLGPWERDPAAEKEILDRSLSGHTEDMSEPGFRVTYEAGPLDRRIDPFETSGPVKSLFDKPDYRLNGSERLRYYLPAYLAKLISARFRLPDGSAGDGSGGSVDIYSRRCSGAAYYVHKLRSLFLCQQFIDDISDAYIRYRTGTDPETWWSARYSENYDDVARTLVGDWSDADGMRLSLAEHGLYTLRSGSNDIASRHGYWGVDGHELWLIEVYREGPTCFNPACRSNFAEGGLSRQELANLSRGGIPSGELRGAFSLPACRIEETRRKAEKPAPSDLGLMIFEDNPCAGKNPEETASTIEIGGSVFTPARMQVLRDLPGSSTDDLRPFLREDLAPVPQNN